MDEKMKFVAACLSGDATMAALCRRFEVSRKTGYKWLKRYRALGVVGLKDLPRAPLHHGRASKPEVVALLLAEKRAYPLWGAKKLMARLRRRHPGMAWPSVSTAGAILKRHGLMGVRKRARFRAQGNGPWGEAEAANAVWSVDHKGWWRMSDGKRCEPLTVMDAKSRYVLGLAALGSTAEAEAWPVFERLFKRFGLPQAIRSDNGVPFAGGGVTGLCSLAVRFIKLDIALQRIDPGKPQQNGQHERFHATMRHLALKPEAGLREQQKVFDAFRREYNEERPHEALAQTAPAEHYQVSARRMPKRMPEPCYPVQAAVRRVRSSGEIKWRGKLVHVSAALIGESVAIEETEDGTMVVRFYNHDLGILDEAGATPKLRRVIPPLKRRDDPAQSTAKL